MIFSDLLHLLFQGLGYIWWLVLFAIFYPLFISTWLFYRQALFKSKITWAMFELRIPREIRKSARAMEQVLVAIHSLRNAPNNPQEKYWDGEVTRWFCLEMVSFGGEVHYYLRVPANLKTLVQAPLFSYYPDIEVVDVDDYVNRLPTTMEDAYQQGYQIWGTEMVLDKQKPSNSGNFLPYPLKTYEDFESDVEEKSFDPMGVFLEVLGKVSASEVVAIQFLIAPMDTSEWRHECEELLKELKKQDQKEQEAATPGGFPRFTPRTPGETDVIERVEKNMSKPAFEAVVRFMHLSSKTNFSDTFARRGVLGAFNQYTGLNLNRLRPNYPTATRTLIWNAPYVFPGHRNELKKSRLLYNYRNRKMPWHTMMGRVITSLPLNWNNATKEFPIGVESMATLFHPPAFTVVTAPHIRRVESKKMGPPAGLSIYGEEEDLGRFM